MSEVTCIFYVVTLVCGFIVGFLTHLLIENDRKDIEAIEEVREKVSAHNERLRMHGARIRQLEHIHWKEKEHDEETEKED